MSGSTSSIPPAKRSSHGAETRVGVPGNPLVRSEGQRLILEVTDSLTTIAKKVGAGGKATVAHWRSGARKPDEAKRKLLAKHYKIPVTAWDELPAFAAAAAGDASPTAANDGEEPPARPVPKPSSVDHFIELISEVRNIRASGKLAPSERLKAISEERALLAQYARIQDNASRVAEMIIRDHPHWKRFEDALMAVLAKYPEAAREVAEVLEKI